MADTSSGQTLNSVFETIIDRKANPKPGSYTNSLFDAGLDEITKKVGEEAIEVIIAAQHQGNERLISELADLTYHSLVLMAQMGLTPEDVAAELLRRHKPR
jgi:phosphoribosyl-ATP pyrophosphohydrolase